MAPQFFGTTLAYLKSENVSMVKGFERDRWLIWYELPKGAASKLNEDLLAAFDENGNLPYRPLPGKGAIQSIFAVRFSNMIFENVWNRSTSIMFSTTELAGVEERGGYYDQSGALRDMVPNHANSLSLLAMDKPASFTRMRFVLKKIKVFKSLN